LSKAATYCSNLQERETFDWGIKQMEIKELTNPTLKKPLDSGKVE